MIKRETPIVVVMGNPPYVDRAKQRDPAPWIEEPRQVDRPADILRRPSLDEFRTPGKGRLDYKLYSTGTYFWRWATWKVFDAHPQQPYGVVALVTTSAYLTGEAFAGMRRYLRETAGGVCQVKRDVGASIAKLTPPGFDGRSLRWAC